MNLKPFKTYPGGKDGNGTYQTIINFIPVHKYYFSLFLGNCAITRRIKPALFSVLNDIDCDVIDKWKALNLPDENYQLFKIDALTMLKAMQAGEFGGPDIMKQSFIYLDPPYFMNTRKSQQRLYKFEVNEDYHSDLLTQLLAMSDQGYMIMISAYPNIFYDACLYGWNYFDFPSTTRSGQVTERIYFNYEVPSVLHDYSYFGKDFRQREAHNRIRNNIINKLNRLNPTLRNSIISDITTHFNAILQAPLTLKQ
jgi:DNA adenine methylase